MVTKSLLDKILSKTVKRNELNALSLSKKDRDRIYDNILNGGGEDSNNMNFYDVYDIVGVYCDKSGSNNNKYTLATSNKQIIVDKLLPELHTEGWSVIMQPITTHKDYIIFDFSNNSIKFMQEDGPTIDSSRGMFIYKAVQSTIEISSDNTINSLLLLPKNINIHIAATNDEPEYNYNAIDKIKEISNPDNIILNPTMDKETSKYIFIAMRKNP